MITISEYTTKTPMRMIGEFAGFCWGANTKDNEKNVKRAIDCIMSEHGRTEEFPDLYLIVDGTDSKKGFLFRKPFFTLLISHHPQA